MREIASARRTIQAIKKCGIKGLDEFIEMVLFCTIHGSPADMEKMANVCGIILEKTNYFNRGGKKYTKMGSKKLEPVVTQSDTSDTLETSDTIYL